LRDYLNHWHSSRVSEDYIRRPALAQIEQHLSFGLALDLFNSRTAPALRQCLRVNCGDSAGNLCFSVKGPALQKVTGFREERKRAVTDGRGRRRWNAHYILHGWITGLGEVVERLSLEPRLGTPR
jgi:hypothetical protein